MGTQWTAVVLVSATGPLLVGVLRDTTGGYETSFVLLGAFYLAAAVLIAASGRTEPSLADVDQVV
jgi:cyanate permease